MYFACVSCPIWLPVSADEASGRQGVFRKEALKPVPVPAEDCPAHQHSETGSLARFDLVTRACAS